MSVSNYIRSCDYSIGKLKDYVYLIDNDALINYSIDNGSISINEIEGDIYKLYGNNILLEESESFDKRFKFSNELTLFINEDYGNPHLDVLDILSSNKYKICIENQEGTQFIINLDFPSTLTYTYTYTTTDDGINHCELTFKCVSNIPMMVLNTFILDENTIELYSKDCNYNKGGAVSLRLINKENVLINSKNEYEYDVLETLNGDSFSLVDFLDNGFTFTHQYNNGLYNDIIQFTIPLSQYKYSFHYNLIEFINNKYIALFTSKYNRNNILSGIEFGYFPSYSIATAEDSGNIDLITIKLTSSTSQTLLYNKDEVPPKPSDVVIFVPIDVIKNPNNGLNVLAIECISKGTAKRLLLQESTINGELINRYWVLKGYEALFSFLNIVGTYELTDDKGIPLIVNSSICSNEGDCSVYSGLPINILFTKKNESIKYKILTSCDWTINNIPSNISIDIKSGLANLEQEITITNLVEPTDGGTRDIITLACCNSEFNTAITTIIKSGWIYPTTFYIDSRAQDVTSFLDNILQSNVEIVDSNGLTIKKNNGTIVYTVPTNLEDMTKVYTIQLKNKVDNSIVTVVINQDKLYSRWVSVPNEYICENKNSYEKLRKYIGYSSNDINIPTDIYMNGRIIKENDERCNVTTYRWVSSGHFTCDGNAKYEIEKEQKQIGVDGEWIDTNNTRLGALVEQESDWCINPPIPLQYQWIVREDMWECATDLTRWVEQPITDYICEDGNKYYKELEEISKDNGITWIPSGKERKGKLIEMNSIDCGYIDYQYRYLAIEGEYICNLGSKYKKTKKQRSIDGVTWEDVIPYVYGQGSLIERDSQDCMSAFEYKIMTNGIYSLPLVSVGNTITVDWGDGVVETISMVEENPAHQYSTSGTYTVKITGDLGTISSGTLETWSMQSMRSINSFGNEGLRILSMYEAFYKNTNLSNVPNDIGLAFKNCNDFTKMFYGCDGLKGSSPTYNGKKLWQVFNNKPHDLCFYGCRQLTDYGQIPDDWK